MHLDCLRDAVRTGQKDLERRAVPGLAVDKDRTTALLHDAVYSGESEARALPDPFGREERLEQVLPNPVVHADTGIADCQHDVRADGRAGMIGYKRCVEFDVARFD